MCTSDDERTTSPGRDTADQTGVLACPTDRHALNKTEMDGMLGHEKPLMPKTRRTSLVNRRESRTGKRSSNASSDGSCVQPSIGMPFAGLRAMVNKDPHFTGTWTDLH